VFTATVIFADLVAVTQEAACGKASVQEVGYNQNQVSYRYQG